MLPKGKNYDHKKNLKCCKSVLFAESIKWGSSSRLCHHHSVVLIHYDHCPLLPLPQILLRDINLSAFPCFCVGSCHTDKLLSMRHTFAIILQWLVRFLFSVQIFWPMVNACDPKGIDETSSTTFSWSIICWPLWSILEMMRQHCP